MSAACTSRRHPHEAGDLAGTGSVREGAAAFDSLGTDADTMALLSDRRRRRNLLAQAAAAGRVQDSVAALSRFLPASQEPDPAQGRWHLEDPATVAADLWSATVQARCAPPGDLVDHVSYLARFAPHTIDRRLRQLSSDTLGAAVDGERLRIGRLRLAQLRRQAEQAGAGQLTIPASLRWADSIVAALAANTSVADAWAAVVLCDADQASVQRVVCAAAYAGNLATLSRLLRAAPVVHDLDIIARAVLARNGTTALEQLCRDIRQASEQGTASERRLGHLLDGLVGEPLLDGRFWAGQPVPTLRRDPLDQLLEQLITETLDLGSAQVAAGLTPVWEGTLAELADCATNLLTERTLERAPDRVAGTLQP